MGRNVKKSKEESLEILREYLTTNQSKRSICRKYGLDPNWVSRNLIKFAVADKKDGIAMKKLPGNVSVEKTYRDDDRAVLQHPDKKKIRCQVVESLSQKARPGGCRYQFSKTRF